MKSGMPIDLAKTDVEFSRPISEALKGATKAILTSDGRLVSPDGTETTLQALYEENLALANDSKGKNLIVIDSFAAAEHAPTAPVPAYKKATDFEDGFYWWHDGKNTNWKLAEVQTKPFVARFFGGGRISNSPWGNWKPAEVNQP